jgi:hypothetical protein
MPDLKSNYDRLLLAGIGLIAAAATFFAASSAFTARDEAVPPQEAAKQEPFASDSAVDTLKADRAALAERKPWNASEASPFVSRIYLLKDDRLVDILESGNDLFPGISNAWLIEHELDYLDPGLPEADPDTDGFTNLEEFTAKTSPRDGSSKPAEWIKLRLGDVKIEQLQLIFTGRDVNNEKRAMINSVSASSDELRKASEPIGPTTAYVVGQPLQVRKYKIDPLSQRRFTDEFEIDETPFTLAGFKTVNRENPSITTADGKPKIDEILFAVLESKSDDGTIVELEAGKPQTSPYSLATLQDTRLGGTTIQIRIGEAFDLGGPARYKLVDVSEESATIEDLGSGDRYVIPKAAAPPPPATPEDAQPQ